jgi:hypothetical protein
VSLWESPVRDVRPLAIVERARLLGFLDSLTEAEWLAPSAVPGWTVKNLALHLLDDDLGWLSRARDEDFTGLLDMSDRRTFVELLAAKNQAWVDGTRGLSRRVVTDLLVWSGAQVDAYHASQDLMGPGYVSWASDDAVPYWFNLAQEFTERWVHQQQMREAVGRVDDHLTLLPEVLHTFVWALPHQFHARADSGSDVEVRIDDVGVWTLTAQADGLWELAAREPAQTAIARLTLTADAAWRMFTGAPVPTDGVRADGPAAYTDALLAVRGIIV